MTEGILVDGGTHVEVYTFPEPRKVNYGVPLPVSYIARGMEAILARQRVTNSGIQETVQGLGKEQTRTR